MILCNETSNNGKMTYGYDLTGVGINQVGIDRVRIDRVTIDQGQFQPSKWVDILLCILFRCFYEKKTCAIFFFVIF